MSASTVYATVSQPGPAGPPGYSPQFIVAAGPPSNSTGNNGDMYINSTNGDVYGPKVGGLWGPIACNIRGTAGATGPQGPAGYSPQYIVAAGAPASATGNNGDMYINSTTSDVYGPKMPAGWGSIVCNIKGNPGPQGPPGVGYNPRGAWSSSTTYAQGDQVTYSNQLYISLQGSNLNNNPSTSPTFWEPVGSGGAAQSPWLSDIDGAGYKLKNAGRIAVSNDGTVLPDANTANPALIVGVTTAGSTAGEITACGNAASGGIGVFQFANYANAATDKRVALILGGTDGAANSGLLAFATYNAGTYGEKMRITSGGNVGIGDISPAQLLSLYRSGGVPIVKVVGDWNVSSMSSQVQLQSYSGTSPNLGGVFMGIANRGSLASPTATLANDVMAVFAGQGNPASPYGWGGCVEIIAESNWSSTSSPTYIAFTSCPSGSQNFVERMRITSDGKVGIGTPTPANLFTVAVPGTGPQIAARFSSTDSAGATSEARIVFDEGGGYYQGIGGPYNNGNPAITFSVVNTANSWTERMRITSQGYVGINNPSPQVQLSVYSTTTPGNPQISGTTDAAVQIRFYAANVGTTLDFGTNGSGITWIQNRALNSFATVYDLALNPAGGKVGIGIVNPSFALHVNGTAGVGQSAYAPNPGDLGVSRNAAPTTGVVYFGNAGSAYLYWDGTSFNLSKQLVVTGDCNITGTYRVNGTPISTGGGALSSVAINPGRAAGTVYQNNTGKPIFVSITGSVAAGSPAELRVDSVTPPINRLSYTMNYHATQANYVGVNGWVLPGYYYQLYNTSMTQVIWAEYT